MSYTKRIGDKEYEFASEKAYETYLKLATTAAQQNGTTRREAFEANYQKYVDVGSPLVAQKKEVQTDIPNEVTPTTPNVYEKLYGNAEAYKNSMYGNANSSWQSAYALAEKARQEAEAQAEIERKRGVVDSDTLYQQQKATYGANAEQLGRMGLNVSGYSDYLNSQAYASGMAYRQAANAQAAESKRQATYQEAIAKLEADKARDSALAQADQAYYTQLSNIALQEKADADAKEAALKAEQQAQEQQKQTAYYSILDGIANGTINKDNIGMYLDNTGLSDTTKDTLAKYAKNKINTSGLETSLAAYEASKDFVNAAISYVNLNYTDATDEQKKTFQADYIVNHIGDIDDSKWSEYANKINNGDYGTAGGEAIKKAVSQSYIDSADMLSKEELKTVIDSGILTTEAQSKLESLYATKFAEKNQTSAYSTDVFGKYSNPEKVSAAQSDYADAIVEAAKNGKINEGDIVAVVLNSNSQKYYKYVGGNKFEEVSDTMVKYSSDANVVTIDGYEITREEKGSTVPYYSWKVTKKK